jgi:hypothetical protein
MSSSITKYQSKRRGKLSTDAESVERREWYENLQRHILLPSMEKERNSAGNIDSNNNKMMMVGNNTTVMGGDNSNVDKIIRREDQPVKKTKIKANSWIRQLNAPRHYTATVLCFHGIG